MKKLSSLPGNVLELVWKINFVILLLTIIKWMTIDVFMNTVEGWNVSKTSAKDRDEHFWQRTVAFYNKLRKSLLAHSWLNVRFWCFISFANLFALRRLRWKRGTSLIFTFWLTFADSRFFAMKTIAAIIMMVVPKIISFHRVFQSRNDFQQFVTPPDAGFQYYV